MKDTTTNRKAVEKEPVILSNESKKAIDDFMHEQIGPLKVQKMDIAKNALLSDQIANHRVDTFQEYGIHELWYRIWQKEKGWIKKYIVKLEKAAIAAKTKKELDILTILIPYSAGSEYKERVNKLDDFIHEKIEQLKKR